VLRSDRKSYLLVHLLYKIPEFAYCITARVILYRLNTINNTRCYDQLAELGRQKSPSYVVFFENTIETEANVRSTTPLLAKFNF
jgi:hypothetical protein